MSLSTRRKIRRQKGPSMWEIHVVPFLQAIGDVMQKVTWKSMLVALAAVAMLFLVIHNGLVNHWIPKSIIWVSENILSR